MINISQRKVLVDALLRCGSIANRRDRDTVVSQLSVGFRISRSEVDRTDIVSIVNACCDWEGGLDELIEAISLLEGDSDRNTPFKTVQSIVKQIKSETVRLSATPQTDADIERYQRGTLTFGALMAEVCERIGWTVAEIGDNYALLNFDLEEGYTQPIWLTQYDSQIEAAAPSIPMGAAEEELPDELSTLLMIRSSQCRYGFWTIQVVDGQYCFSCMSNVEIELADELYLKTVVEALLMESLMFIQMLADLAPVETGPDWSQFKF